MLAVFADPVAPELARALDLAGYTLEERRVGRRGRRPRTGRGLAGGDRRLHHRPRGRVGVRCASLRKHDGSDLRVLVLVGGAQLGDLDLRDDLFDDFCLSPFHPTEFEARVRHLLWSAGDTAVQAADLVEYGELVLNLETYQATIEQRPLDLTYMEYELLKFLAQNPGKVFTREILLSRVWGYEYYGGARTVDVHIRRLRAKLGEEHAGLIATVRSVGYRFGQSRWGS